MLFTKNDHSITINPGESSSKEQSPNKNQLFHGWNENDVLELITLYEKGQHADIVAKRITNHTQREIAYKMIQLNQIRRCTNQAIWSKEELSALRSLMFSPDAITKLVSKMPQRSINSICKMIEKEKQNLEPAISQNPKTSQQWSEREISAMKKCILGKIVPKDLPNFLPNRTLLEIRAKILDIYRTSQQSVSHTADTITQQNYFHEAKEPELQHHNEPVQQDFLGTDAPIQNPISNKKVTSRVKSQKLNRPKKHEQVSAIFSADTLLHYSNEKLLELIEKSYPTMERDVFALAGHTFLDELQSEYYQKQQLVEQYTLITANQEELISTLTKERNQIKTELKKPTGKQANQRTAINVLQNRNKLEALEQTFNDQSDDFSINYFSSLKDEIDRTIDSLTQCFTDIQRKDVALKMIHMITPEL